MFIISVKTDFNASHQLTLPNGSKEQLHNHGWEVIIDVSSEQLTDMGLVMDFVLLKGMVEKITGDFEGKKLEEIDYFQQNGSSAEIVARHIYEEIEPQLPDEVRLEAVSVVEAPGCSAKFSK